MFGLLEYLSLLIRLLDFCKYCYISCLFTLPGDLDSAFFFILNPCSDYYALLQKITLFAFLIMVFIHVFQQLDRTTLEAHHLS